MAGKRPDQYRIAPDEAGATDYKTLPNDPRETDRKDKLPFTRGRARARGVQEVPPKVLEPAAEKARAAELRRRGRPRSRG